MLVLQIVLFMSLCVMFVCLCSFRFVCITETVLTMGGKRIKKGKRVECHWDKMKDDVIADHILPFLGGKSLVALAQTCSRMKCVVLDKFRWKRLKVRVKEQRDLESFGVFVREISDTGDLKFVQFTFGEDFDSYKVGLVPRIFPNVRELRVFFSPVLSSKSFDVSGLLQDFYLIYPNVTEFWLCCENAEPGKFDRILTNNGKLGPSPWNITRFELLATVQQGVKVFDQSLFVQIPAAEQVAVNFDDPIVEKCADSLNILEIDESDVILRRLDDRFVRLSRVILKCEKFTTGNAAKFPQTLARLDLTVSKIEFSQNVGFPGIKVLSVTFPVSISENQNWQNIVVKICQVFPNLQDLRLESLCDDVMNDQWLLPLGNLPNLEILKLAGFSNLIGWFLQGKRFPMLRGVEFRGCGGVLREILEIAKSGNASLAQGMIRVFENQGSEVLYEL